MLTICYASATYLQSWRIKGVCVKIAEQLAQASVSFYSNSINEHQQGFDALSASSELCINRRSAKISQILWLNGNYRGCCLSPVQAVSISSWISFPKTPCLIPFACGPTLSKQFKEKRDTVYLLLETEIEPSRDDDHTDFVKIEEFGTPIAWKIDSHLAVLLATDVSFFTRFLVGTFLKNQYCINDELPLIRIQSIKYDGTPQPYELLTSHLRKSSRSKEELNAEEWKRHLEDLHALSVLAHQAIAYESGKSRTPVQGQIKPDLIPKDKENATQAVSTATVIASEKTEIKNETSKLPTNRDVKSTPSKTNLEKNKAVTTTTTTATTTNTTNTSNTAKPTAATTTSSSANIITKTVETPKSSSQANLLTKTAEIPKPTSTITAEKPKETKATFQATTSQSDAKPISRENITKAFDKPKPLNILVYSDVASVKQSALDTLKELLPRDVYTIYPLTQQQLLQKYWFENTALIVVCGTIAANIAEIIVDYFLRGGKLLSLCSDILHFILPNYRTAEVREHELVNFSYAKWKKVKMMHHIFCYQASPVKKNFSTDSEESSHIPTSKSGLICPRSLELKDLNGGLHGVQVDVLGTEETWNTPSLLVAKSIPGGRAVFSQVHLEMQPSQFEDDELRYAILKQNDKIRLDILADLLSKHLGVDITSSADQQVAYQNAFFLGRHESKFELSQKLSTRYGGKLVRTSKLSMQFCGKGDLVPNASNDLLPILMHSCPDDFSTVEYFENLKTDYIGRLVIYAPIVNSSQNVINEIDLANGFVVLARQQTSGIGRSNNQWLSPLGCAMFSLQLHIDLDSNLGRRLPLIQHLVAVAIVNSIKSHEIYKVLDIGIKWPNDIYAHGTQKIGGLVVRTMQIDKVAIVNIGCGINLDNKKPTICLNDLIDETNKANKNNLPHIPYEKFLAWIFNEIERIVERAQKENFDFLYKLYYELWLHSDQNVVLQKNDGKEVSAKVIGIDDYGFLKVQLATGAMESVQPDGNSFDMLKGLILPKQN